MEGIVAKIAAIFDQTLTTINEEQTVMPVAKINSRPI